MQADVNSSSVRVESVDHSHLHSFHHEHVANGFTYDNKHTIQYVLHDEIPRRRSLKVRRQEEENQWEWRNNGEMKRNRSFFTREGIREKKNRFRQTPRETVPARARADPGYCARILPATTAHIAINGRFPRFLQEQHKFGSDFGTYNTEGEAGGRLLLMRERQDDQTT